MSRTLRRVVPLVLSLMAVASAARAADETAPIANPRADETAAQIEDWIAAAAAEPTEAAPEDLARPVDRRIHGEVGVGIGTNGYRSAYGVATMPIGKSGTATVALSEDRMNFRGRRATDRSVALSLAFGDTARSSPTPAARGCDGALALGPFNRPYGPLPPHGIVGACREPLPPMD